jgi:hypothetical protein
MGRASKELNLQHIKRSRLKQGDVFAMRVGDTFLFGRITNDKLPMMGTHVALVYIYSVRAKEPKVDISELTPDKLLLPPLIMLPSAWSQGHAVRIASSPIQAGDSLIRHCFKVNEKKYVDEFGDDVVRQNDDYCGTWGITSLGVVDDAISDALGIKRAPLQVEDMWYTSGKGEKIWLKEPLSELKKYSNYEEIIKQYPEIIE